MKTNFRVDMKISKEHYEAVIVEILGMAGQKNGFDYKNIVITKQMVEDEIKWYLKNNGENFIDEYHNPAIQSENGSGLVRFENFEMGDREEFDKKLEYELQKIMK